MRASGTRPDDWRAPQMRAEADDDVRTAGRHRRLAQARERVPDGGGVDTGSRGRTRRRDGLGSLPRRFRAAAWPSAHRAKPRGVGAAAGEVGRRVHEEQAMSEWPSGTVTFLFTDLEDSTRLWDEHPDDMRTALARHDAILREVVAAHDGLVVKSTGDGAYAVFGRAGDAGTRSGSGRGHAPPRRLAGYGAAAGPARRPHRQSRSVGTATTSGRRSTGRRRLMAIGYGGQILLSQATAAIVRDELTDEHALRDPRPPPAEGHRTTRARLRARGRRTAVGLPAAALGRLVSGDRHARASPRRLDAHTVEWPWARARAPARCVGQRRRRSPAGRTRER